MRLFFFFKTRRPTCIYTFPQHAPLPISRARSPTAASWCCRTSERARELTGRRSSVAIAAAERQRGGSRERARELTGRSEEHTSELQSRQYLVCRLLLEKKKKKLALICI